MENKNIYAVMKLTQNIILTDRFGKETEHKLSGKNFAGYIPVFYTYEEAYENSDNGKFQILTMVK